MNEDKKSPQCPYCYNGIIVKGRHDGKLFCNSCKGEVDINEY